MSKNEKIEWVTSLKFIGIIAVIVGHTASPISSFIYIWHMPLFFMIAGFFIKLDVEPKVYLAKQIPRVFLPYFFFAVVALIIESLKRQALNRPNIDWEHSLTGVFLWMDFDSLVGSYAFVLWFLPAVFFGRLFVYLILKYFQNTWLIAAIFLFCFALSFFFQLPFAIDEAMNAVIFIAIGFWIYGRDYKLLPVIIIFLGLNFAVDVGSLDMASKYYDNVVVNLIAAISSCLVLISVMKKLSHRQSIFMLWGSNTLLLFIVHPYTNNIATIMSAKFASGHWIVTITISLLMLQILLMLKKRFNHWKVFRYV